MRAYSSKVGPCHLLRVVMVLALSICVASPGSIASAATAGRSLGPIAPLQGGFVLNQVLYAPLYFAYGGFEPVVYIFNRSNATVGVELDLDPTAPVTIGSPFLASVAPGKVVTVNLVDYLTLTDPDETLVVGGLRLRHDGADANAISAVLSVDNNGFDRAFSIAFTAAGTPDPATEQRQYAMAYLGQDRTCTLAVQNTSDADTWVEPTVYYETSAGSPPAPIVLPALDVEVGRTNIIDLTSYLTAFDANASQRQWGVIKLRSPKNTVVARAVTTQA